MVNMTNRHLNIAGTFNILGIDNEVASSFKSFIGFKAPCHRADVEFENDQDAALGNVLALEIVRPTGSTSAPVVRYPKAKESKMYELIMVDYDKLRMNKGDWIIWNVESISGEVLKTGFNENPEDPGA